MICHFREMSGLREMRCMREMREMREMGVGEAWPIAYNHHPMTCLLPLAHGYDPEATVCIGNPVHRFRLPAR
jgi:hypothetical protein